jgi:hypothetical protein
MQLTHSLKAPGFNPRAYEVKNQFQASAFKFNLYRYMVVEDMKGSTGLELKTDPGVPWWGCTS